MERRFFEDVEVGEELGPDRHEPDYLQLLEYAAASRDLSIIHHDREFARKAGLPDVIVQGSLKAAFMSELVLRWAGSLGKLLRLKVEYRGVDVLGPLITMGKVVEKRPAAGEIECDLVLLGPDGKANTRGAAVVYLPSREGPVD